MPGLAVELVRFSLMLAGGLVAAIILIGLTWLMARRRKVDLRSRPNRGGLPLIVGRTTHCSLCDTHFDPPLQTRHWAKCPRCGALVQI